MDNPFRENNVKNERLRPDNCRFIFPTLALSYSLFFSRSLLFTSSCAQDVINKNKQKEKAGVFVSDVSHTAPHYWPVAGSVLLNIIHAYRIKDAHLGRSLGEIVNLFWFNIQLMIGAMTNC